MSDYGRTWSSQSAIAGVESVYRPGLSYAPVTAREAVQLGDVEIHIDVDPTAEINDQDLVNYITKWMGNGLQLGNYIDFINLATKIVDVLSDKYKAKSGRPYTPMMKKEICVKLTVKLVHIAFRGRNDPNSIEQKAQILQVISTSDQLIDVVVYLSKNPLVANAWEWVKDKMEDVGEYAEKKGCFSMCKKKPKPKASR